MRSLKVMILAGAICIMSLSSCEGIFSDIYDEPVTTSEYGFVEPSTKGEAGKIYVNATDYKRWTYIDFSDERIDTLGVDEAEPADWDIAIHRYDVKTNGGAVAETTESDIYKAIGLGNIAEESFVEDIWTTETIITDVSNMMAGYLEYKESYYNPEMSKWLNVDKSEMPPIYTPSERVYVVKMKNGERAAVKLENYMDDSGVKGYMTLRYIYPL